MKSQRTVSILEIGKLYKACPMVPCLLFLTSLFHNCGQVMSYSAICVWIITENCKGIDKWICVDLLHVHVLRIDFGL